MKTLELLVPIVTLSMVFLVGCVRTSHSPHVQSGKAMRVGDPMFMVKGVKLSDNTVRFSFITDPNLRTSDPNIRWVEAAVGVNESNLADTLVFNIDFAGAPGSDATVHVVGDASWDTPAAKGSTFAIADISVVTSSEHLIFRQHIEYSASQPMELTPFSLPRADTLIDLGVMAKRVFVPPGEYLPSSESFRIVVSDQKGYVIYRSDAGMAFLSVISTVEPQSPNQMQRYAIPWNGKDLKGMPVPDGKYVVEMIIPAVPKSYNARLEFEWPPR